MKKQTHDKPEIPPTNNRELINIAREGLSKAADAAIDRELATDDGEDYGLYSVTDAVKRLAALHQRRMMIMYKLGLGAEGARHHADDTWRAALPEITNKHNALIYIAAIAWGMRNRIIDTNEAKTMIFLVQTQLTVLKADSTSILRDGTLPVDDRQLPLPGLTASGSEGDDA